MTEVSNSNTSLAIEILGWDKLWSFKSRLEIPLGHVSGVRTAERERVKGIRAPGTHLPWVIIAGTFRQWGKKVFWDVHNKQKAIAIDLHDEPFCMLVIEVTDPQGTIREIRAAVAQGNPAV